MSSEESNLDIYKIDKITPRSLGEEPIPTNENLLSQIKFLGASSKIDIAMLLSYSRWAIPGVYSVALDKNKTKDSPILFLYLHDCNNTLTKSIAAQTSDEYPIPPVHSSLRSLLRYFSEATPNSGILNVLRLVATASATKAGGKLTLLPNKLYIAWSYFYLSSIIEACEKLNINIVGIRQVIEYNIDSDVNSSMPEEVERGLVITLA